MGKPLAERSYAEDCRVFTPEHPTSYFANISDAVFDVHFVAHLLGWWGKMLIMRDWYVAWACSIGFEICEISFRHWLNNFYECWWDHLFLDLFGCNLLGIILGAFTLKQFGSSRLRWVYDPKQKQAKKSAKQPIDQDHCSNIVYNFFDKLRPTVFERYEWAGLQDIRRLLGVTMFCLVCLIFDCNNFFMKYVLWVPAEHDLLKYRVTLLGLASIATAKEWYEFISNTYCHRLGTFAWLSFYTVGVELLLVIRFSKGQFTEPFPWFVKLIWSCIAVGYACLLYIAWRNQSKKKRSDDFNPYNPDIEVSYQLDKRSK